jgi:hypothetical protein
MAHIPFMMSWAPCVSCLIRIGLHDELGCQTLHLSTVHRGDQFWSTGNKTRDSITVALCFLVYHFLNSGTPSLRYASL